MKTDRELLELAAKAARYKVRWCLNGIEGDERECFVFVDTGLRWEPQDDDGDALRLAVKLRLQVTPGTHRNDEATAYIAGIAEAYERVHDQQDLAAATRRAIVRAAAAIALLNQ